MPLFSAATALATAKGFIPKNWQQVVNLVAVGGLCLTLGFCKGEDSATAKYEATEVLDADGNGCSRSSPRLRT